nr:immunoglobulin heavy chain junction region [Macaca mulatta]
CAREITVATNYNDRFDVW